MQQQLNNDLKWHTLKKLSPPIDHISELPISESASKLVNKTRMEINDLLYGVDDRLLVVVGPCSIHDIKAAEEYARLLVSARQKYAEDLLIVMRAYLEKPRTRVGWKGLINDPNLDNSCDIDFGIRIARNLLLSLNNLGIPVAIEFISTITLLYLIDLISWGTIGARTTESPLHREFVSGLTCPVGFKNNTAGNIITAINAILSSRQPHHFVALTQLGYPAIVSTEGNVNCHIVLRGGKDPNYSAAHVLNASSELAAAGLPQKLMIDFSHANSQNDYYQQLKVGDNIAKQIAAGSNVVFGVMLESHLFEGRQNLQEKCTLNYGQSITDACIGWKDTEVLLGYLAEAVRKRRSFLKGSKQSNN